MATPSHKVIVKPPSNWGGQAEFINSLSIPLPPDNPPAARENRITLTQPPSGKLISHSLMANPYQVPLTYEQASKIATGNGSLLNQGVTEPLQVLTPADYTNVGPLDYPPDY